MANPHFSSLPNLHHHLYSYILDYQFQGCPTVDTLGTHKPSMSDDPNSRLPVPGQTSQDSPEESSASEIDEALDDSASGGSETPVDTPPEHTPPSSGKSGAIIRVSNTFNLHANLDPIPPNVVLLSSGRIFFSVHQHRLIQASFNNFGGVIDPTATPTRDHPLRRVVDEDPSLLNIVLHCVYGIPCDDYCPTFECLTTTLPILEKYGLALSQYLAHGTPLYNTVLNYAPLLPIETYALAASHNLEDLAVTASSYTLHVQTHRLPHDLTDAMGTKYLQRLHLLHASRLAYLKELFEEKVFPHIERPYCSVEARQVVSKAYRLAGAQIFFNATPAISRTGIEPVMHDLIGAVTCPDCRESLVARVDDVITRWMLFKRTI